MHVAILGTGTVGTALAVGFTRAGHTVLLGSRTPDETATETDAEITTQRDAAERGDVVILALPANAAVSVTDHLADALAGKPVLDAANEYPEATSDRALAARVADAAPEANVVKAFNTIGANLLPDPELDGEWATMFLAGDDSDALDTAETLAADLGFEPVVAGDLDAAAHLENLARFWIHLSGEYGRDIAFRLLRK
jgi:hypothetical protein